MDESRVCCIILGGGRGTRLKPLVLERSKPAVPLGGKYRMIDIPVSNCINSNMRQMYVLTQFNSASLNNHIVNTYRFDPFSKGAVQILAAEQTDASLDWFQGTADAVRKHLIQFNKDWVETILILSGDQIYRMDYRVLLRFMKEKNADVVVGTVPVTREAAQAFGIMRIDNKSKITDFSEKPKEAAILDDLEVSAEQKKTLGITDKKRNYLGSMGIYLFKKEVLFELLSDESQIDFGKHLIPTAIEKNKVFAYPFQGYWEDVGTIRSYFEEHIAFASANSPFDFYDEESPIYTHHRYLSASNVTDATVKQSLICDGCVIEKATIEQSVVGVRSVIHENSTLNRVVMLGNDYYDTASSTKENEKKNVPPLGIGKNCTLKNVILDKNVRIGDNVTITNEKDIKNMESSLFHIMDGIVVIPKNTVIKSGTVI